MLCVTPTIEQTPRCKRCDALTKKSSCCCSPRLPPSNLPKRTCRESSRRRRKATASCRRKRGPMRRSTRMQLSIYVKCRSARRCGSKTLWRANKQRRRNWEWSLRLRVRGTRISRSAQMRLRVLREASTRRSKAISLACGKTPRRKKPTWLLRLAQRRAHTRKCTQS